MNQRIKELAEQASCDIKDEFGYWVGREFDKEKFAELIVLECLTLTLGKDRRQLLDKGDLNSANLVQKDIIRVIKHFGVEE